MTDGTTENSPEWVVVKTIDKMQEFYLSKLPEIREAAHSCGYAIGVHGSTRRDFDLMAMPWIDTHTDKNRLAKEIQKAACGMFRETYDWEQKPSGRFATSFPICWFDYPPGSTRMISGGHIDLSVATSTHRGFDISDNSWRIQAIHEMGLTHTIENGFHVIEGTGFKYSHTNLMCAMTRIGDALAQKFYASKERSDEQKLQTIKTFLKMRYGRELSEVHDDMDFLVSEVERLSSTP